MIIQGRLLTTGDIVPEPGWLRVDDGRIVELGRGTPHERPAAGDDRSIICPGFVDAHVHLPQMHIVGCDGLELLDWLEEVVFPAELGWADVAAAEVGAAEAHGRLLRSGTLGYAGYLTSHTHAVEAAISAGHAVPLRAVVGQVLMDRHAPAELLTSGPGRDPARLARSRRARMSCSVNPRFAVACSDTLLRRAATRAQGDVLVQTHLAESVEECRLVRELFPDDPHYTGVYDRCGLLGPRTLLAHGLHLSDDEWRLIARRGSVIVHCPTANTFLRAGVFDLGVARRHGVRLALGSDIAAGPDTAMPRVARAMIEIAKLRALEGVGDAAMIPTPGEVWDLITRGNAEALGFDDMGRLEAGASADLLVLRTDLAADRHIVGRLIYNWRDDYIERIVLNGRLIDPKNQGQPPMS